MNAMRRVRCPHCQTVFRVAPAKLERSHGWARCGHCFEPFDTERHALDVPDAASTAEGSSQRLDFDRLLHTPASAAPDPSLPELDRPTVFSPTRAEPALGQPSAPQQSRDEITPKANDAARATREDHTFSDEPLLREPPLVPTTFPFERESRHASPLAVFAALLLLFLALGQVAYLWRQEWIQRFPLTFAYWERVCQELGCTVTPPLDTRTLVIEHSELIRESAPGRWTLGFTLRNRASHPTPWPTLEFTLKDAIGRVLLRRHISPSEWGAEGPYFPPNERIERTLALETFEAGIVGYEIKLIQG
jgi:predicted Zn finger-like uncharacterized protein